MPTEIFRRYLEETACLEPKQVKAVLADDPLVVVSAGAGTGKTLTLAWRFVRLVAVNRVPVERILTITFTEKAALEMRERIRRLMEEVRDGLPEFAPLMHDPLSRLEDAYISTIHAFSMRVLTECGLSADVDPGIRVITPPEENAFWQYLERSIDRETTEILAETLGGQWRERADEIFSAEGTADLVNTFGAGAICDAASSAIPLFESRGLDPEQLWNWADELPERDAEISTGLLEVFAPEWRNAWETWMKRILPEAGEPGIFRKDSTKFSARASAFMETWKNGPKEDELPRFVMDLLGKEGLLGNLAGATGKCMKAVEMASLSATGERLKDFRNSRGPWVPAAQWIMKGFTVAETRLRSHILKIIALCWRLFDSAKAARGTLSFDDMIRGARDAVSAEPSFAGKFLHVIVDEFQDTNSIQDELLSTLAPQNGTLFLVGDLQQSIYRFRHAEPAIFWRRIREALAENPDSLIPLDVTFRCRQSVMDRVNSLFGHTWREGVARSIKMEFSPLAPPGSRDWWAKRQETTVTPFELLIPDTQDLEEGLNTEGIRIAVLRMLSDRILEAIDKGSTVWDSDGAGGFDARPVSFRDFAVLVPSRAFYDQIEQVFIEERGIPTYFEGNRNYFGRGEVRDAVRLLEAAADPDDTLAMSSFLASPLSGLSPEVATGLISLSVSAKVPLRELFRAECPDEEARFEALRRTGLAAGPSSALAKLLEDSSVVLSSPAWKRPRVAANLRRAVDLAREYEASMGMSLSGCASYLRYMTVKGIDSREADTLGDQDDMVRIMTVHSAKGLEFPVVAVAGLEQGLRTRGQGIRLIPSPHLGIAATVFPDGWSPDGEEKPLAGTIHDILETNETREEKQRLLYVASTRARDSLILLGACPIEEGIPRARKHSWLETVRDWMEIEGGIILSPVTEAAVPVPPLSPAPSVIRGGTARLPERAGETLERISATAYALIRYCPYAFRMRHRQGLDISWELYSEGAGGSDLGSLAHWILRRWDLRPETLSRFDPLGEGAGLAAILPPELRPPWSDGARSGPLFDWLGRFAASPIAERIRRAECCLKELPFRIRLESGTLMVGAIDILWRENGTVFIRDFKTGKIDGSPKDLYSSQILFYSVAARRHFGNVPMDLALVSLRDTSEIRIENPGVAPEELEGDISAAAAEAVSGPFSPSRERCPVCPWKGGCFFGQDISRE
jgi:ATP-dependent exoDNAse (exonuclease V) beta subunit